MIIRRCHLICFGKFNDWSIDFTEGLNVLYALNEGGKTTLADFVQMMFYGSVGRKQDPHENLRLRYRPDSGTAARGRIFFEAKGQEYLLERTFSDTNARDHIELRFAVSGEAVPLPKKRSPGELFWEMDAETFRRTVLIGAQGGRMNGSARAGRDALTDRLISLMTAGTETDSYHEIRARLEKEQRRISGSVRSGGLLGELDRRLERCAAQRLEASEEERRFLNEVQAIRQQQLELEAKKTLLEQLRQAESDESLQARIQRLSAQRDRLIQYERAVRRREESEGRLAHFLQEEAQALRSAEAQCRFQSGEQAIPSAASDQSAAGELLERVRQRREALMERLRRDAENTGAEQAPEEKAQPRPFGIRVWMALAFAVGMSVLGGWLISRQPLAAWAAFFAAALAPAAAFLLADRGRDHGISAESGANRHEKGASLSPMPETVATREAILREEELLRKTERELESWRNREWTLRQERQRAAEAAELLRVSLMKSAEEAEFCETEPLNRELTRLQEQRAHPQPDAHSARPSSDALPSRTALESEIASTEKAIAVREATLKVRRKGRPEVSEIERLQEGLSAHRARLQSEASALHRAQECLEEAFREIQNRFGPGLNRRTGAYFARLTGRGQEPVRVASDFTLSVETPAKVWDAAYLSTGTEEQLYLALRLAVCDLLAEGGETRTILLDDALAFYDDERAKKAFSFLKEFAQERATQVLFFTCHARFLSWIDRSDAVSVHRLT
ncbi:MAG: AAA family ATPase [Ndongobacter sp.]|nr:AAA family ATPase [Ndongobacter sp.]